MREGRLEAFRMLGEEKIPAVVIDAPENECLVMSLVENIARRQHRPLDIMQEIGGLHVRGYSDEEIAKKIGCSSSWVNMILMLLDNGEERLVAAVETGVIPLSLAVDIAKAGSEEAQNILMEAYTAGKLKGRKLTAIRDGPRLAVEVRRSEEILPFYSAVSMLKDGTVLGPLDFFNFVAPVTF